MSFNGSFFGGGGLAGGAAGSSNIADWKNLTASEMSTDLGEYTNFTLSDSTVSGYSLKVLINADILVLTKRFPFNRAAVIYFDTGITNADIGDGDNRIITIQTMAEFDGLEQGGTIRSDTTHQTSIVPFISSQDGFPFATGDIGLGGTGVTFEGGNVTRFPPVLIRNTLNPATSGIILGAASTLLAFTNEATLTMRDNPNQANACWYRGESQAYWDNGGENALAGGITASLQDLSANAFAAADNTVKIGVAFHLNLTQDASYQREINLNFKYRILKSPTP